MKGKPLWTVLPNKFSRNSLGGSKGANTRVAINGAKISFIQFTIKKQIKLGTKR